jgi:hypothetical protein
MRFTLTSGTDIAAHALYDPAAVTGVGDALAVRDPAAWARRLADDGRLLHYDTASDGEVRLQLCVDEAFTVAHPHTRVERLDGAILRVPSGELRLVGLEYAVPSRADAAAPRPMLSTATIPPGVYRVTAWEIDYPDAHEAIGAERDALLQPGDRRYAGLVHGCLAPIGVVTILAAFCAGVVLLTRNRPWDWRLPRIATAAVVLVASIAVLWRLFGSPRLDRWRRADETLWARYPHTVIELRRLPEGEMPAAFAPARFQPASVD